MQPIYPILKRLQLKEKNHKRGRALSEYKHTRVFTDSRSGLNWTDTDLVKPERVSNSIVLIVICGRSFVTDM